MKRTSTLILTLSCAAAAASAQSVAVGTQIAAPVTVNPPVIEVAPLAATPAKVLPPAGATEPAPASGETSIVLDVSNGIRFVPPSRISVPVGETLFVTGPGYAGRPLQWSKNGQAIPGATGNPLVLSPVTAADAGTYTVQAIDPLAFIPPSQALILGVGPVDRLANISSRGTLAAGVGQSFTAGFIVAGGATQSKKLILRAVGPTLASFGVATPLRAPVLRVYNAAGKPYTNGYAYPAVVGGPTYESDLAESLAKTGAFPIPQGTLDAVVMMPFAPGAYTAQVTSGDNTAGAVLVEVYEVP